MHPVLPILASTVLVRLEKIESNVSAIKDSRWVSGILGLHLAYKVVIRDVRWVLGDIKDSRFILGFHRFILGSLGFYYGF